MANKGIQTTLIILTFVLMQVGYANAESRIRTRKKQMRKEEASLTGREDVTGDISSESNLDEYIEVGLKRNPGLKGAFYQWKSSFKKIAQTFSLPDPQFTYTDYLESVETRVGPQNSTFSIKQKFPTLDKLWIRKSKAFKASEVAYYNFEKKRLDLIFQITEAYYEYVYLNKAILLTKENMKLLGNFESVAQARYASGLQKNQDLLKVQVELGKLENELYSLEDLRTSLTARLNALLNLPQTNMLPWPNETLEEEVLSDEYDDIEKLMESLRENNPQLRALAENVKKNKDALKLSKREYFPDVTVGFTQIDTGDALNPALTGSGKDAQMVMFSVNVPIWFHRLNAGVQDARASLKASENLQEDKENELLSRLALVNYKLHDAVRQSGLYQDALIPKAQQTLNATQSGYEAGDVDFLSLIDAQRVLLSFQLSFYRHNANFNQRLVELKSLLGEIRASSGGD